MPKIIDKWEQPAQVFLVDTKFDKEAFLPLLNELADSHKTIPAFQSKDVYDPIKVNFDIVYDCLDNEEGLKFLVMLGWDWENQTFIPFAQGLFEDDDVDAIVGITKSFMEVSIQLCCKDFELTIFNDNNKLLALCVQTLCENELNQHWLQRYRDEYETME